jgi:hypothetical protein
VALGLALCAVVMAARAQLRNIPLGGSASKLSSVVYFKPPNDQQIQLRLSGAEMSPLPGTLFDVKQLTVEEFSLAGKLQAVVEAPQCIYAPWDGVANSPGHLQLRLQEDRIHVEGDGFEWRQKDNSLVISNNVSTIIKTGTWSLTAP